MKSAVGEAPIQSGILRNYARWNAYQRERFPLVAHGLLIAAFSFSTISYSSLLRHAPTPPLRSFLVAFFTSLLLFLQLRLADEFKDFEEDSRFRPYRPVPRGLVSLRELGWLGLGAAVVQLALALWLRPALALILLVVWAYLGLMSREFFIRNWLKKHPFIYLWSHMLIMPLADFYVTACDWLAAGSLPGRALLWFLLVSFTNGIVLEIGRKTRAPEEEEVGVETYSALWGRRGAAGAWLAALGLTAIWAVQASREIHFDRVVVPVLGILLLLAVLTAVRYLRLQQGRAARQIETLSGIWTLILYLTIGAIPRLLR